MTSRLIIIIILFIIAFLNNGCTITKQTVSAPVYRKIHIPKNLLITYEAPKTPVVLNEAEISKYTLDLYTRFEKNKSKKIQIQNIITEYNLKK